MYRVGEVFQLAQGGFQFPGFPFAEFGKTRRQRERLQPVTLTRPGQQLGVDADAGHDSNASMPSTKT